MKGALSCANPTTHVIWGTLHRVDKSAKIGHTRCRMMRLASSIDAMNTTSERNEAARQRVQRAPCSSCSRRPSAAVRVLIGTSDKRQTSAQGRGRKAGRVVRFDTRSTTVDEQHYEQLTRAARAQGMQGWPRVLSLPYSQTGALLHWLMHVHGCDMQQANAGSDKGTWSRTEHGR